MYFPLKHEDLNKMQFGAKVIGLSNLGARNVLPTPAPTLDKRISLSRNADFFKKEYPFLSVYSQGPFQH